MALALLVIPIVIRTTENMLMLVPGTLREAAFALGAPKHVVITRVTLRAARSGVVTGVLLAVARIAGETAPLLFYLAFEPVLERVDERADRELAGHHLPVRDESVRRLAAPGLGRVLLITLGVLGLNIIARVALRSEKLS